MRSGIIIAVAAIRCWPLAMQAGDLRLVDAAMNDDTSAVRALIQQKADVNAPLADGTTALHWAVRANDLAMVESLLAAGANVKARDRYGLAPVSLACSNANAAILAKLLDAGADPNSPDPQGTTALMIAARTDGGTRSGKAAPGTWRRSERHRFGAIHRAHVGGAEQSSGSGGPAHPSRR